jgi:NarL family two-component system response regulator LiaR
MSELTPREQHILALLTQGLTNKEIAARAKISPLTVKTLVQRIFRKLKVSSRLQAMLAARGQ